MSRISDHSIDPGQSGNRKPIDKKINFYVDGFGAYKTCQQLYEIADSRLEDHLRSEARVETQSQPEGYRCCEAYGRQEIPGEFVVAGRDAAEVLEAAEHGLDPPTILVAAVVILDWALSITTTGDHRDRALFAQGRPDTVGIVAAVGDHPLHADGLADQQVRALHIGRIAGRQDEAEWSPENIDKRVDLRRPATTRDANGIGPRPPFAPPAERWALM